MTGLARNKQSACHTSNDDLSLGASHPQKNRAQKGTYNPSPKETDTRIPGTCWLASLAQLVISRFSERPCPQHIRWRISTHPRSTSSLHTLPHKHHKHVDTQTNHSKIRDREIGGHWVRGRRKRAVAA